MIPIQRILFCY